MARKPKNAPETAKAAPESGVQPVVAVNRIVYGDKNVAPSGSLFTPTTQKEYDELFAIKAVREPTDAELALYERIAASKPAKTPAPAAPVVADAEPPVSEDPTAPEENPLG